MLERPFLSSSSAGLSQLLAMLGIEHAFNRNCQFSVIMGILDYHVIKLGRQ